ARVRAARRARGLGGGAGDRVRERRYLPELPLGGEDGPPWSKGLMARALTATGLSLTRAYELTRRAETEIVEDGERLDLDRFADLAEDMLGGRQAAMTVG